MAGPTQNECFAPAGSHDLYPHRFLATCVFFQVFERPNMVDLDMVCGTAMLTFLRQQAFFEFRSGVAIQLLWLVLKSGFHVPNQRNTSPGSHQWFFAFA